MSKNIVRVFSFILILALLYGCSSAPESNTFAGTWVSNVGKVSFTQNGDLVYGVINGYGNAHNATFTGTLISENEASFSTEWFGDFNLVVGLETFKSTSPDLSFCGIRAEISEELPEGCGFSGTWLVPSKSVFLEGTTLVLNQIGDEVSGDFLDKKGKVYDSFSGFVYWGKGWRALGTSQQRGELTININAAETGLEFIYSDGLNKQQLCAVRAGQVSAYLGYFTCEP